VRNIHEAPESNVQLEPDREGLRAYAGSDRYPDKWNGLIEGSSRFAGFNWVVFFFRTNLVRLSHAFPGPGDRRRHIAAPFPLMQPGMGAGIAASRTPRPNAARLQSLVTHAFFGFGLYAASLILNFLSGK
jgi:Protein of unknown function (DUF2938)